jgi:hypothetical protein
METARGAYAHERRRAYVDTPSLRQEFPRVEQLVVQLSFVDPKGFAKHSPQMHTYSPAAKAFFAVACPSSMCLHGGFDLGPAIAQMLSGSVETVTVQRRPRMARPDSQRRGSLLDRDALPALGFLQDRRRLIGPALWPLSRCTSRRECISHPAANS